MIFLQSTIFAFSALIIAFIVMWNKVPQHYYSKCFNLVNRIIIPNANIALVLFATAVLSIVICEFTTLSKQSLLSVPLMIFVTCIFFAFTDNIYTRIATVKNLFDYFFFISLIKILLSFENISSRLVLISTMLFFTAKFSLYFKSLRGYTSYFNILICVIMICWNLKCVVLDFSNTKLQTRLFFSTISLFWNLCLKSKFSDRNVQKMFMDSFVQCSKDEVKNQIWQRMTFWNVLNVVGSTTRRIVNFREWWQQPSNIDLGSFFDSLKKKMSIASNVRIAQGAYDYLFSQWFYECFFKFLMFTYLFFAVLVNSNGTLPTQIVFLVVYLMYVACCYESFQLIFMLYTQILKTIESKKKEVSEKANMGERILDWGLILTHTALLIGSLFWEPALDISEGIRDAFNAFDIRKSDKTRFLEDIFWVSLLSLISMGIVYGVASYCF